MKWKLSTSRHKVSSWRELWSGEWSQQPRLRDLSLWAGPPQRPSPQFWLGVKSRVPRLGQKVPPDGELQRRSVEKGFYIWEPYSARPPQAMKSSRTRSSANSLQDSREQSDQGKCIQIKPRPRLHHRVQSKRSWMREGEPEWAVRRLSRRKQIQLCLAELPPYQLHHFGVEPQFTQYSVFIWGSTISHTLLLCGTVGGAGFRCLGLLPLSSPGDMNTAGEEFLECSRFFSLFLKSLDNQIHSTAKEARGRNGSIHKEVFNFSFNVTQVQP